MLAKITRSQKVYKVSAHIPGEVYKVSAHIPGEVYKVSAHSL